MRFSYAERVRADIDRWLEAGLIDEKARAGMLEDLAERRSSWTFSTIVALLGVICLAFAVLSFVAANWTDIPRIGRVIMILSALWASYGAAIWCQRADHTSFAQALVMLGCVLFGSGIMLVGQMYHLQGDAKDAVLVWMLGSLAAAILLRATPALALAIILSAIWLLMGTDFEFNESEISWLYPVFLAVFAVVCYFMHSRFGAHLVTVATIVWALHTTIILSSSVSSLTAPLFLYCALLLIMGLAIFSRDEGQWLRGFEAPLMTYVSMVLVGLAVSWILVADDGYVARQLRGSQNYFHILVSLPLIVAAAGLLGFARSKGSKQVYDLVFVVFWMAVAMIATTIIGLSVPFAPELALLGLSVWLIRMGDRQEVAGVLRLGYIGFAAVLLIVYIRTAGSLMGGTIFYAVSGMLMVGGAIFLPRLLRNRTKDEEAVE